MCFDIFTFSLQQDHIDKFPNSTFAKLINAGKMGDVIELSKGKFYKNRETTYFKFNFLSGLIDE